MSPLPEKSVAFTGNRNMIPPPDCKIANLEGAIRSKVAQLLKELYDEGKRHFFVGGAVGFDLIAAEEVIALRNSHCDVELIVLVPFLGQESKYSAADKERYREMTAQANNISVVSDDGFSVAAYHQRNELLAVSCSCLVAYSDGNGAGTLSTIRKAKKRNVRIINIYQLLFGEPSQTQLTLPLY